MIVAGVMSGTSADGINVALVRIGVGGDSGSREVSATAFGSGGQECPPHTVQLLGHAEYPYPQKVRAAVLAAMNASRASVADLARLNFLLGELYGDAVLATERRFKVKAELIGCHGQTLYHQSEAAQFLGRRVAATWQTGEAAVIAARVGVPVVSDFRPADMAAGGKGAPLVPYLDYLLFRDPRVGRIVQNIGGIANLTAIPAGAAASDVVAFDTGPGNMVIDAVTEKLFGKPFDRGGKIATSGKVVESVVERLLRRPFYSKQPPKAAGREEFGREFVDEFLRNCRGAHKQDVVATATALTAKSIADAVGRFLLKGIATPSRSAANAQPGACPEPALSLPKGAAVPTFSEMIVSGGGTKNAVLVKMLTEELTPLGVQVRYTDEYGLPSEAKEAVAFAVLACETWHRRTSNVPSATGAKRSAVLGKITFS
jgi:anhydro-N-acetylmuramic acid kinase